MPEEKGERVTLLDPQHPAHTYAGRIVLAAWAALVGCLIATLTSPSSSTGVRLAAYVALGLLVAGGAWWLLMNLVPGSGTSTGRHAAARPVAKLFRRR